jgi:hypothetical protein
MGQTNVQIVSKRDCVKLMEISTANEDNQALGQKKMI